MNKPRSESTLWLGLLTTPLALVADSLRSGFAIGAITLLITLTTFILAKGLARITSDAQRQATLLIVAALVAAVCDLLLRAFAMPIHAAVQLWLPLAAITSVLLLALQKSKGNDAASPMMKNIYVLGFAVIAPLVVGAARELTGVLFILMPGGILISIALLIAAKNRWRASPQHPDSAANNPRTRRVRVTGPVS